MHMHGTWYDRLSAASFGKKWTKRQHTVNIFKTFSLRHASGNLRLRWYFRPNCVDRAHSFCNEV